MTQEDLLAIGQLMDQKFDEKLAPINRRLEALEKDMKEAKSGIEALKKDMTEVKADIKTMKEDLTEVRTSTNALLAWAEDVGRTMSFPLPKII